MTTMAARTKKSQVPARYDKHVIARALAVYDVTGNVREAARAADAHHSTVKTWIENRDALGFPASMASMTLRQMYDDAKHDVFAKNLELQKRALKRIEQTINKANAYQAALIYGILTDKVDIMLRGDAMNAEASVTPRADMLSTEEMDNLIALGAKIAKQRKDEMKSNAIDAEYTTVAEDDIG
jgi:hypothetical protein